MPVTSRLSRCFLTSLLALALTLPGVAGAASSAPGPRAGKSTTGTTARSSRRSTGHQITTSSRKGKAAASGVRRPAHRSTRRGARIIAFDPGNPRTLRAEAAVVVDTKSGRIVWAKNAGDIRPIASITKLMSALVFLDHVHSLTDTVTVSKADVEGAGRSHVRAQNRVALYDLLCCSLIASDNAATRTLARSLGVSDADFADMMNERARSMGLTQTHYVEPTGLDQNNISTALDQARLLCAAYQNPVIAQITSQPNYMFRCSRRIEQLNNTNRLLRSRSDIVSGKTGFTRPAGYCLATLIGDRHDPHLTAVVLGAPTNSSRFAECAKLIDWALGILAPTPALAEPGGNNGDR